MSSTYMSNISLDHIVSIASIHMVDCVELSFIVTCGRASILDDQFTEL